VWKSCVLENVSWNWVFKYGCLENVVKIGVFEYPNNQSVTISLDIKCDTHKVWFFRKYGVTTTKYIFMCVFIPLTCLWRVLKPVAGVLLVKIGQIRQFSVEIGKIYIYKTSWILTCQVWKIYKTSMSKNQQN